MLFLYTPLCTQFSTVYNETVNFTRSKFLSKKNYEVSRNLQKN